MAARLASGPTETKDRFRVELFVPRTEATAKGGEGAFPGAGLLEPARYESMR